MIDQLFGSKTRVKLLHLFYGNPNRSFYVREITRKIDEQINSVRRELSNLLTIGIIKSDSNNNKLYYEVNQQHKYYKPLHVIFSDQESISETDIITPQEKEFKALGSVQLVYMMGKFVRDANMPVDLLIVGDVNRAKFDTLIAKLEQEEGFEINYSIISEDDYNYRSTIKDRFISDVEQAKKTIIVDKITTDNSKGD